MKKLTAVCLSFFLFLSIQSSAQDGKFSFNIPSATRTSAGVFKDDSILVRTLWNNVDYKAGTYSQTWDGKDDDGKSIINSSDVFSIKLMSSNVNYQWQGVLGNTSKAQTGSSVHRGYYRCMQGLVFTNGYGYLCKGYAEGAPSLAKFLISDPQSKIDFIKDRQPGDINYVATDDQKVYWGVFDASANSNSFVFATNVSDDSDFMFPKGQPYTISFGRTYARAISVVNQTNALITGLAVQKSGNFLFVTRADINQLQVLNKTTGELVKTLSFSTPKSVCVDKSDNLWMVTGINTVSKYTVNSDGSLSSPTLSLAGLLKPAAIQVNTDGSLISVADDSTSQQLKFFNNSNGSLTYTLGDNGGYFVDPDVTNNKFYFGDLRNNLKTFIAYQPDGSFWVGDPGNYRAQHYSPGRTFIDRVQSLGATYNTGVDDNNITRIFSDNLEFAVDYSVQTLSGSKGWTLVKNWGANIPAYPYHKDPMYQTTLSNGRTYGFIRNLYHYEVVEYPKSGPMRFTNTKVIEPSKILCADGSLQDYTKIGNTGILTKYPLIGFDGLNNPRWSTTGEVLASTPILSTGSPTGSPKTEVLTSSNKVVHFNYKVYANNVGPIYSSGYHLGITSRGGNSWLSQTEKSTFRNYTGDFPNSGYFDVGNLVNDYGGGNVNVIDRNIFTSYHGEFWKNGQTNMYNHYWDNGLAVGQFGITRDKTVGESAAKMAGNALTPKVVKDANGDYYLYHGDESDHAGIHRWKITGLNTIKEEVIPLAPPITYNDGIDYVDLMKGLPADALMPNNVAGWSRNPTTNSIVDKFSNAFSAFTGRLKVEPSSPDILLNFVKTSAEIYTVNRDLGSNNVTESWKISGELAYPGNAPNVNSITQYFEVLDDQNKVLTRFYPELDISVSPMISTIFANKAILARDNDITIRNEMNSLRPFEVKIVNGTVTFTYSNYAPVTTAIYDAKGDWRKPTTLRVIFNSSTTKIAVYQTIIDLKDLKFYKDYLPVPGVNTPPVSNAGNDKIVTLPLANSTSLIGSGSDADGTISSYLWSKISGPAGGNITSGTSAGTTITGLLEGNYYYQLKVTDNKGATTNDTVFVKVNSINQPPTANAGPDIVITFPILNTVLSGSGSDADGTIAGYSWEYVSGPANFLLALPTSASTLLSGLIPGVYEFKLTVNDNRGATSSDIVKVTVNLLFSNKPPVVNAGPDKTFNLPSNSVTLYGSGSDPDGSIKSFQWRKISGPDLGVIAAPNSATSIMYNLAMGVYIFELSATDNSYAVSRDSVKVTINAGSVNQIPTVNAGPDKYVLLPSNTTYLAGSGQDLDGPVTFKWSWVSGPSVYYFVSPDSSGTELNNLVEGDYVFELKVTDIAGVSVKDLLSVKVYDVTGATPKNLPPTANAGVDQLIVLPTNTVTLSGVGIDPDGSIVNYSWAKVSGTGTYKINSPTSPQTTISNLSAGTYQFQLQVTDNNGETANDYVQVTVNTSNNQTNPSNPAPPTAPNQVPTSNAGSDVVITLPTNSVNLSGNGVDSDGVIATYTWSKISGPINYNINSPSSANTIISNLVEGVYVFQLKVIDDAGASAFDNVQVTVKRLSVVIPIPGINQLPTADAGPDVAINLPTTSVTLYGGGTDPDGSIASYVWTKVTGVNNYTIQSPTSGVTVISNLIEGRYQFQLKVIDNSGASAYDYVYVTVSKAGSGTGTIVNQAPSSNAGSDIVITLPTNSVNLSGSGVDSDGVITSYEWAKISGPASYDISSSSSASTTISNLVEGDYVFQLKVIDDNGAIAYDEVQVTVNKAPVVAPAPGVNQLPVPDAGPDVSINLPTNSVTLYGSGTDADGYIATYKWTKVTGVNNYTIQSPSSATTVISGLIEGTYQFQLKVIDNSGASAYDYVYITVSKAGTKVNQAPVSNAGSDISITLPTNSVNLSGSGVDSDGVITNYEWAKISGPTSYNISSSSSANTTISNLLEGDYVFQLKVTDDSGASAYDEVQVTVNTAAVVAPPSGVNQVPVSDAGPDVTISLPTNSVTLYGGGTDPDGYIAKYAWTKVSGVNNYTIKSPSSATTVISGLIEGTYQFQLKVIDNSGASAYDYVYVTVTKSAAPRSSNTNNTANPGTTNTALALNSINTTNELKVYPNPARDITNLQIKTIIPDTKLSITIVNAAGIKVKYKELVLHGNNGNLPLDMSGLSDGIYIISIRLPDGSMLSSKVVKYGGSN
ncbi:hypothetical protein BH11BAC3_BH11BAC3_06120 [soil metagenome]